MIFQLLRIFILKTIRMKLNIISNAIKAGTKFFCLKQFSMHTYKYLDMT